MSAEKIKTWDREIMDMCPILYCQHDKSMMETCMCWGFECDEGWKSPLEKLSCKLEAMNLWFYPKYGIRIQADQVKEKYGTLRFYHSIIIDNKGFKHAIKHSISSIVKKIRTKFSSELKQVIDKKSYTSTEIKELSSKVEFVKAKYKYRHCANVKVYEKNGKYFEETQFFHPQQMHYEPTKNKFLNKIANSFEKLTYSTFFDVKTSKEQDVIFNFMNNFAETSIREAEEECNKVCEICGTSIGSEWSPTCQTNGWIKYLCEKCAKETNTQYYKNGDLCENGKVIKTKAKLETERKTLEKKLSKQKKDYDKEEAKYQEELKQAEAEVNKTIN